MAKSFKGKENGKTIMLASISYTWYNWCMCMHWLKCVRLNRKDRLKTMRVSVSFLINGISNGYVLITILELKPLAFFAFKHFHQTFHHYMWLSYWILRSYSRFFTKHDTKFNIDKRKTTQSTNHKLFYMVV